MSRAAEYQDAIDRAYREGELVGVRSRVKIDTSRAYLRGVRDCLAALRKMARASSDDWVSGLLLDDLSGPDMLERFKYYEAKLEPKQLSPAGKEVG